MVMDAAVRVRNRSAERMRRRGVANLRAALGLAQGCSAEWIDSCPPGRVPVRRHGRSELPYRAGWTVDPVDSRQYPW